MDNYPEQGDYAREVPSTRSASAGTRSSVPHLIDRLECSNGELENLINQLSTHLDHIFAPSPMNDIKPAGIAEMPPSGVLEYGLNEYDRLISRFRGQINRMG